MAQAGADDYIDLKGRLRDPAAKLGGDPPSRCRTRPHIFNIDLIRAGLGGNGSADVILQSAVAEAGDRQRRRRARARARRRAGGHDLLQPVFRPDDPANATRGAAVDVGFFGGNAGSRRSRRTYNFVNPTGGSAGLVASARAGNIIVTAAGFDAGRAAGQRHAASPTSSVLARATSTC